MARFVGDCSRRPMCTPNLDIWVPRRAFAACCGSPSSQSCSERSSAPFGVGPTTLGTRTALWPCCELTLQALTQPIGSQGRRPRYWRKVCRRVLRRPRSRQPSPPPLFPKRRACAVKIAAATRSTLVDRMTRLRLKAKRGTPRASRALIASAAIHRQGSRNPQAVTGDREF